MQCFFCFQVHAPKGLRGLDGAIVRSKLNLSTWISGYNGKTILRSDSSGPIDLDMDSSDTDIMYGSGIIELDYGSAKLIVDKLSEVFRAKGYPHERLNHMKSTINQTKLITITLTSLTIVSPTR